ncbi:MAG: cation:proton antiporter [Candidatus Hydrogenedentes bacterium]|nr:cation:proton antiporter [Candidatus Hydrogenedentota bacterium]
MHYLNEDHVFLFLIQVLILLASAKALGALCQQRGVPALAGEILAGILLGPTILGRALPAFQALLFPREVIQVTMLDTVSWFGVLFLLLSTGFEVNISTVWKQRNSALSIGIVGVVIPILMGCGVFFWLPASCWGENASHLTFTLFLATASSITAISIVARLMHDMDILKSDVGSASLSACAVNDVFGWFVFTLVLALATQRDVDLEALAKVLFETVLFGALCLTIGSKIVGVITVKIKESSLPQPGTMLTFIACLGVLCGAITDWIGIHAILGFFLAGIMAGNTSEVSEHTRQSLSQTIHAIFVPLFFAGIGIKVDFLAGADLLVLLVFTAVAVGGKFVGAWAGARMAHLSKPDSLSVGIAFTPGGAMEIIVGMLALEMKLITEGVFVVVVFAALLSSFTVGPLLAWSLRRRGSVDVASFLLRGAATLELQGLTRWDAIDEMCGTVAKHVRNLDKAMLSAAVRLRETIMGTGLERGVAVPHARLKGLRKPIVAFARSSAGIEWDAVDGSQTNLVFLILTPEEEEGLQLQILASIARAMASDDVREALMAAETQDALFEALAQALRAEEPAPTAEVPA